jgi:hypothetical protein
VIRPLAVIVSAILMSRPTMPVTEATRYARVLDEEARKHAFDPLTAVAIIHFESRWQPWQISPDGEDYGLGQVRARYLGACRGDDDPVGHPSPACRAAKATLLAGETNIRRMASIITANRDLCRTKTGNANLAHWLAGYEGLNRPALDRWCAPGPRTWQVVAYRQELVAALAPAPRKAAPKRVAARAAPAARKDR